MAAVAVSMSQGALRRNSSTSVSLWDQRRNSSALLSAIGADGAADARPHIPPVRRASPVDDSATTVDLDEDPDAVVVRAVLVVHLFRDTFLAEVRGAMRTERGQLDIVRFWQIWDQVVAPFDGDMPGSSIREVLADFKVFSHTRITLHESHRLASALFRLIDVDGSGGLSVRELTDFVIDIAHTEAVGPTEEVDPAEARKMRILSAARGLIVELRRSALSWGMPQKHRRRLLEHEHMPPLPPKRKSTRPYDSFLDSYRHSVVMDREQAYAEMTSDPRWQTVPKRHQNRLSSPSALFDLSDLQTAFREITKCELSAAHARRAFAMYGGRIPVADIGANCTRDPLQGAVSFNMHFAKMMRRHAYDRLVLCWYVVVLSTTAIFFTQHEGTGRMPGDVFQTAGVDAHLAHGEFPGSQVEKTFLDINRRREYWEWMYGPVMDLFWPSISGRDHHFNLHGTVADHPISLQTVVLGGVRLRQARAEREACHELQDLLRHGLNDVGCFPYDAASVNRRFHPQCFHEFLGGGASPGEVETESYYIGVDGTMEAPQPVKWKNWTCEENPIGVPTGICNAYPGGLSMPRKAEWQAAVRRLGKEAGLGDHFALADWRRTQNLSDEARMYLLLEPWMHHSCEEFDSLNRGLFPGRFGGATNCDGYGIVIPLTWSRYDMKMLLDSLMGNNWIDEQTRAVHFEFFTYNQHTDLLQRFQYLVQFTAGGIAVPSRNAHSFGIFDWEALTPAYSAFILFVFADLLLLAYSRVRVYVHKIQSAYEARPSRGCRGVLRAIRHAARTNNMVLYDVTQILCIFVSVGLRCAWLSHGMTNSSIHCEALWPKHFEPVAELQRDINIISAFTIILMFLALFHRLRTFAKARMLFDTLKEASGDVLVLALMAIIIFGSLGLAAWNVYSQTNMQYADLWHSTLELIKMMLGDFDVDQLESDRVTFTPIFFIILQIVTVMLLLNMIIAVLANAFATVQADRYDLRAFLERINNDPATRFPSPVQLQHPLNWIVEMPYMLYTELRVLVFLVGRRSVLGADRYKDACARAPRILWEEYVRILELQERGSPHELVAASLVLSSLVNSFHDHRLKEPADTSCRVQHTMCGVQRLLSADDLLDEALSPGRKEDAESLLVLVPAALLHVPQWVLWRELLIIHSGWTLGASRWSTNEDHSRNDPVSRLERIEAMTAAMHRDWLQKQPHSKTGDEHIAQWLSGLDSKAGSQRQQQQQRKKDQSPPASIANGSVALGPLVQLLREAVRLQENGTRPAPDVVRLCGALASGAKLPEAAPTVGGGHTWQPQPAHSCSHTDFSRIGTATLPVLRLDTGMIPVRRVESDTTPSQLEASATLRPQGDFLSPTLPLAEEPSPLYPSTTTPRAPSVGRGMGTATPQSGAPLRYLPVTGVDGVVSAPVLQ
eukprot:TRINITY_DN7596_c0_g1_i1.p1 TRINITY_DN7596_c0_g1~~TRINITY_DN7596_c0_g1_i1.p1  ORF type:complete len:1405 (+),score=390.42 TRINITY_DN7596_c0_g1_i1:90-4304(+)